MHARAEATTIYLDAASLVHVQDVPESLGTSSMTLDTSHYTSLVTSH